MTVFLSFGQSDEGLLSRYGPQNLLASFVQMCYNTRKHFVYFEGRGASFVQTKNPAGHYELVCKAP